MYEDVYNALKQCLDADIPIGKIQLSNAMAITVGDLDDNAELHALLAAYAEPKYLHQVKALDNDGVVQAYGDLADALRLPAEVRRRAKTWRVHFHVPLYCAELNHKQLSTTQAAVSRVLDFLSDHRGCAPFLEVETYSWQVLPPSLRPRDDAALHRNIAQELDWLEKQLIDRALLL